MLRLQKMVPMVFLGVYGIYTLNYSTGIGVHRIDLPVAKLSRQRSRDLWTTEYLCDTPCKDPTSYLPDRWCNDRTAGKREFVCGASTDAVLG